MEFIPLIFVGVAAVTIIGYFAVHAIKLKKSAGSSFERDKALKETQKLCRDLSGDELYEKACELLDEEGIPNDYQIWKQFICAAVEKGNIPAIREWGYYNKNEDNALAVELLTRAADAGDGKAVEELYDIYRYGTRCGVPEIKRDYKKAFEVIKPYADKGNAVALRLIGDYYYYEENDDKAALDWYLKAAKADDAEAMVRVAEIYSFQDDEESEKDWLLKAARQDNAEAESMLAVHYECEEPPEYEMALDWYKKASEHGDSTATCSVGEYYLEGKGVMKDEEKAFSWFEKAVKEGSVHGQYLCGKCYMEGKGVALDKAKGIACYTEAAEYDSQAKYALGLCYIDGNGVAKDVKKGLDYLEKSAERYSGAQNKLAQIYYEGKITQKDEERAHELWREAAKDGNADAAENLKKYFGETND